MHLNLSQDQEKRLEKELAEEKRRTKETDRVSTSEEEIQRLRKLLAEAEVREERRGMTVNLTSMHPVCFITDTL